MRRRRDHGVVERGRQDERRRRKGNDSDEGKEEEEDHNASSNTGTPSVIRATQTFYPNVVEDDNENDDENCAVGVPVLADGSIDFSAYERGQHPPRHSSSSSTTTRDYARALAESEGNQDVSVLLEEDSSTTSSSRTHVNSPNVVELQSYSTGLFDCALDPLNFLKNFLYTVRRGRIRERYGARRMFSNRVEHNIREFFAQ